ncbi:acyltransferase [Methylomonas koyamae]|uniref:acyltransferase family protein n=1 Tax=Methylomonas koyamae TaxID=702114 RepID=UPI0016432539|nr:acyltransferase [Methylomonas koyamae]
MTHKHHVAYLDSMRGLAAMAVISEHYVIAYGLPCQAQRCQQILDTPPFNFWWDGGAAVSMFFVLSGMVLSLKYFRSGLHPDLTHFNLLNYILARLSRLWPPYLAVLALSGLLYLKASDIPFDSIILPANAWLTEMWRANPLTPQQMISEAMLLKMPDNIILLPQAWTLTIELVLSLLLPLGLLLAERGIVWLLFFSGLAVTLLGVSPFLWHFLIGLMIAKHYTALTGYLGMKRWRRWLVLLIAIVFYTSGGLFQHLDIRESIVWASSGFGAALILLFASSSENTQAVLTHPILRQIGRVSYSAYLIHMLILLCVTPRILHWLEPILVGHLALWLGGYLMSVIVILGLSVIGYYFLEIPSISLGRRITNFKDWLKTNTVF